TIDALSRVFGAARPTRDLEVGIGDDAAVLRAQGPLAWTIDTAVEGVHFERSWLGLTELGFRSFQAAARDLAAVGGRPLVALSSVMEQRGISKTKIVEIGRGQARAARSLGCRIVGGNLSRGDALSVTTSVLGSSGGLTRGVARPGDELWLLGDVGL